MREDKPLIGSLIDTDFYKFTMAQLAFHRHPKVRVRFAFRNRTKGARLGKLIDRGRLVEELNHARSLKPTRTELHYLRGTNEYGNRMLQEDFLEFFGNIALPSYDLAIEGDDLCLECEGVWPEVTFWEIIVLEIISELYYRKKTEDLSAFGMEAVRAEGVKRLAEKIEAIKNYPGLTFSDFGTRRRFSRDWQEYVVQTMAEELPRNFLGTSNVYLAMKHDLLPMGTNAHETDMVYSGIYHGSDEEIRESHQRMLEDWWAEYNWGLSIALTDTYGTDFFFRDMSQAQAREWKGLRQDSGNPFEFAKKAIDFYSTHGVDPKDKIIIFSDGLDSTTMISLFQQFRGSFKPSFGWGTNLTNDLGIQPLSLVMKVVGANGHGTVKLSDNLAKAIGKPEDVERFKRIFGYGNTFSEACRY